MTSQIPCGHAIRLAARGNKEQAMIFSVILLLSNKPAIIPPAIHDIICIHNIIYDLEDYHIAFLKQDKAIGISCDIFPSKPRTSLRHRFQ